MSTTQLTVGVVLAAVAGVLMALLRWWSESRQTALVGKSPGRVDLCAMVEPVGVVVLVSFPLAVLAITRSTFSSFFVLAHVAYLGATVALPAVGLVVVVALVARGGSIMAWMVAIALTLAAPIGWYGTHVAPR